MVKRRRNTVLLKIGVFLFVTVFIIGVFAVGSVAYIKIANVVINKISEPRNETETQRLNLVENRATLSEYAKLNPKTATFYETKQSLFEKIKVTNKIGQEQSLVSGQKSSSRMLASKAKIVYEEQEKHFTEVEEYNNIVKNIYSFDPRVYFTEDSLLLIENISSAIGGLNTIKIQLESYEGNEVVRNSLDSVISIFTETARDVEAGAKLDSENIKYLSEKFLELRSATFDYERSLFFNREMLDIITTQTNLIIEFDRQ